MRRILNRSVMFTLDDPISTGQTIGSPNEK